jgi:hypothetical protein
MFIRLRQSFRPAGSPQTNLPLYLRHLNAHDQPALAFAWKVAMRAGSGTALRPGNDSFFLGFLGPDRLPLAAE